MIDLSPAVKHVERAGSFTQAIPVSASSSETSSHSPPWPRISQRSQLALSLLIKFLINLWTNILYNRTDWWLFVLILTTRTDFSQVIFFQLEGMLFKFCCFGFFFFATFFHKLSFRCYWEKSCYHFFFFFSYICSSLSTGFLCKRIIMGKSKKHHNLTGRKIRLPFFFFFLQTTMEYNSQNEQNRWKYW